jgi:hypothetical protein
MADEKKLLPLTLPQNPAPVKMSGQAYETVVRAQVENILVDFLSVLPDNYVSQVPGPEYILQYQAAAEALAKIQISAQEVFSDADFNFTRSEFLFQILGSLVFPRGTSEGIPQIEGDTSYRDFLKAMVLLLLRGAVPDVIQEGIELLTDSDVTIIEKVIASQDPLSAWSFDDQFSFEVNISTDGGTAFPSTDPFVLRENVRLVLQALKPAHTLYDYRHLFLESFEGALTDTLEFSLDAYYYDDLRKYCGGAKSITGISGETLIDRRLFTDVERDFTSISPDSTLTVESGVNVGMYRVESILSFPVGTDSTPRSYTTSPTGLTGDLTISGEDIEDTSQDFGAAVEGEVLTISDGPNAGTYRLQTLLGSDGGLVGQATGPATQVRVARSLLRVTTRMPAVATGQTYTVEVDRLGVRVPRLVEDEDASVFFLL